MDQNFMTPVTVGALSCGRVQRSHGFDSRAMWDCGEQSRTVTGL